MAQAVARIFVELRASVAKFSQEMSKVGKTMQGFGRSMTSVGMQFSAISAPIIGIGAALVKVGGDFDQAMAKVKALGDTSSEQFESLRQQAIKLGADTKFSAKEAAEGMGELAAAGFKGKEISEAIPAVLDMAAAASVGVGEAAKWAADSIGAFALQASDTTRVANALANAANYSQISLADVAETMAYAGPVAHAAGESIEQLAAAIAIMGKGGVAGSRAGTALRSAYIRLVDPPKKAREALAALGVEATSAPGKLRPLADILDELGKKGARFDQISAIFGKEAATGMQILVTKGGAAIRELSVEFKNTQTAANDMAQDMNDTIPGALERIGSSIEAVALGIIDPMRERLKEFFATIEGLVDTYGSSFVGWWHSLSPAVQNAALAFGGMLAVAGPLAVGLGLVIAAVGAVLTPMMAIGVVVGGAIAAVAAFIATNSEAQAVIGGAWGSIKEAFWTSVQFMYERTQWLREGFAGIVGWFQANWPLISLTAQTVKEDFLNLMEFMFGDWARNQIQGFQDSLSALEVAWGILRTAAQITWEAVKVAVEAAITFIGGILTTAMQLYTGTFPASWEQMKNEVLRIVADLVNGIKDWFSGKLNAVMSSVTEFTDGVVDAFRGAYDTLVGHSIVPDTINEIGKEFTKLGPFMLEPTQQATEGVVFAFGKMSDESISSLTKMGDGMTSTAGKTKELAAAARAMRNEMQLMAQESAAVGDAFGSLFEAFGMGKDSAAALSRGFGALINQLRGGGSSGTMGFFKDIAMAMGGQGGSSAGGSGGGWGAVASAAASYFGGSGGAGAGGGQGAGWMQAIGSYFGGGGGGASNIGPVASGEQYGAMLGGQSGGGGAWGAGGGGWAAVAEGVGNVAEALQADYSEYGARGNEEKARAVVHGIGMAVANFYTFGIVGLVEKMMGKEKFRKLQKTLDPIGQGLLDEVLQGLFGQNAETYARRQVRDWMNKQLKGKGVQMIDPGGTFDHDIDLGPSDKFNTPGWADSMNASQFGGAFNAVGQGLVGMLGITEDIGGQIAKVIFDNMGGSLDNLRILMQGLGVTAEQMTQHFVSQAEKGQMSWFDMEVALQGVNQAFGEGLAAVGDYGKAFDIIINSGGEGMDAIIGLKNSAIEAAEAGLTSFEQWKQGLLAQGKSVEYVDSLFTALAQRGITSFDQLKEASNRDLGGVIADMQAMSPALANVWLAAQEAAKGLSDTMKGIPNPLDVKMRVTSEMDDGAKAVVGMSNNNKAAEVPAMARGGIVNRPTFAMVGEAGPEAVIPLSRLKGMVSGLASGMQSGGGPTYHIDARGAGPGVEATVLRALRLAEQRSVEAALVAVADARDRGGNYAESF